MSWGKKLRYTHLLRNFSLDSKKIRSFHCSMIFPFLLGGLPAGSWLFDSHPQLCRFLRQSCRSSSALPVAFASWTRGPGASGLPTDGFTVWPENGMKKTLEWFDWGTNNQQKYKGLGILIYIQGKLWWFNLRVMMRAKSLLYPICPWILVDY